LPSIRKRPKIAVITTVGVSLDKLFPDFYPVLRERGYEVTGICARGPYTRNVRRQGVRVIDVPMSREFTIIRDFRCLWKLYRIFKAERFDILHYSTPKAAFLSAIAGRLSHCPNMIYTLRGLGFTAFEGLRRVIAKHCEKISCGFADCVVAIGKSIQKAAIDEKVVDPSRIIVLGGGSSKGVNLNVFQPNDQALLHATKIRQDLGIGKDDFVVGYAGRLTPEKGILELLEAFLRISAKAYRVHLLLVGDQDHRNPLSPETMQEVERNDLIHLVPFSEDVQFYFTTMDVVTLPSHREGFGNILIEASAMKRPVIASNISGCRDAVLDGVTGILVRPRDSLSLQTALELLMNNPDKRSEMGRNARKWVEANFDRNVVWSRIIEIYERMIR
jgi:glycosyltransferase involved in cell wall biosynthesis